MELNLAVAPVKWSPMGAGEAHVEVCARGEHTHLVRLDSGEELPVRVLRAEGASDDVVRFSDLDAAAREILAGVGLVIVVFVGMRVVAHALGGR